MQSKPETYPPLYVIFTLLNAIRRGIQRKNIWREFRRQKIALKPRLAFWIALCKEAGLVAEYDDQLWVTRHAPHWLSKTPEELTFHLIESWQNAPKHVKVRQFRRKLIWKLKYEKPLTPKDLGTINGLEALGLFNEGQLTAWGKFFLKGEASLPTPRPLAPCKIHEDRFIAPLPQHTDLLWDLEKYLRPASPGIYPLDRRTPCFHNGDPQELIDLLERGLQDSVPDGIKARLLDQPSLRVIEGVVLEFSHPADLRGLRRQPNLRQHFEQVLSPRHIFISAKESTRLFQMLRRRGVHVAYNEEPPHKEKKRTHFTQNVLSTPQKNTAGSSTGLLRLLHPLGKAVPKLELVERYLQLQQALDVLYRAPGYPAEQRRITPLLIEQSGEQTYVIAYCQTRRAQRTFRLDRMEIPGTY